MSAKLTSNTQPDQKSFSWKKILLWSLFVLLLLLAIIRASLPYVIKYAAINWFESNKVTVEIDQIDLAFLKGEFAINNVKAINNEGKGFSFNKVMVSWQWKLLLEHLVIVDEIIIDGIQVDAALYDNGDMDVAGIKVLHVNGKDTVAEDESLQAGTENTTPWDMQISHFKISDFKLCAQKLDQTNNIYQDYCASFNDFEINGNVAYIPSKYTDLSVVPLQADVSVILNNLSIDNKILDLSLIKIKSVDLNEISVDTLNSIAIKDLNVKELFALQRKNENAEKYKYIYAFSNLSVSAVRLKGINDLKIGLVNIKDSQSYFIFNTQGENELSQWLVETKQESKQESKQDNKPEDGEFSYALEELAFNSRQHHVFVDNSGKKPVVIDVHDIDLTVKAIDSTASDNDTHIKFSTLINKHASLDLDVTAKPLSEKITYQGQAKISGLDLRILAPMTNQFIGQNIKSGQLDADIQIDIDKGTINSELDLVFYHLQLKALSKERAEELKSEFGFPLNSALSLLRDKDNAIRLSIPVTGDVENPEFNPRDAIITATSKAITTAVLHYYTPFGLVFAAESLFDLATALKFDPVIFQALESELDQVDKDQLDTLAKLMKERPGIHLTLCGVSNEQDKLKLFPDDKKKNAETKNEIISSEQLDKLDDLAHRRSSMVKSYLVDKNKIEPARLVECAPGYSSDGVSGVLISI